MRTGVRGTLGSVIGVALAALLVAGCTTLPAPRGESDTALVIPVEKDQSTEGTSTFGYYEVSIARSGDVGGSFVLTPGSITISPKVFRVVLFKKDADASQEWMGIRWSDTNEQQRQKAVKQLEESENFGAWRIAGGKD
jgi:hypothetical protein